jgi:hypothetical protein
MAKSRWVGVTGSIQLLREGVSALARVASFGGRGWPLRVRWALARPQALRSPAGYRAFYRIPKMVVSSHNERDRYHSGTQLKGLR